MRTNSIRFATWMCVLALAGCAQRGSATPGTAGESEEFEVAFNEAADPFDEPPADPSDSWPQPQDSSDPWSEPQDPSDAWPQPQAEPSDSWPQPPAEPSDAWPPAEEPPPPEQPQEPPPPEQPQDPWDEPTEPIGPNNPGNPWNPWAPPQDPNNPGTPPRPGDPQDAESETRPHEPQDPPPPPPSGKDPWAQQPQEPDPSEQPQPADPTGDSANRALIPATAECPRGSADSDEDGLCDSAEAKYGTKVNVADTDGDALSDGMEVYGIEFNGRKLDMAALYADPLRRDVFLEIDWVKGYRPHSNAIQAVVTAFAAAGVTLHAELGQEIAVGPDIPALSVQQVDVDFKQPNLDPLKAFVYRWALFAHSYNGGGSSGVAPYENSWLIVSLGNFKFKDEWQRIRTQAGTLMHELGHTFNLRHGGINDDTNFKPNHMSVMNYHYQFTGIWRDGGWALDYSSFTVDGVSESLLSETAAFAPGETTTEFDLARYSQPRICKKGPPGDCETYAWLQGNLSNFLDFNDDGFHDAGPIAVDLNGNGVPTDYFRPALEEWSRLGYSAGNVIGNLNPQKNRSVASSEMAQCQGAPKGEF